MAIPSVFRDTGVWPFELQPPQEQRIRAYLNGGRMLLQYVILVIILLVVGMFFVGSFYTLWPLSIFAALATLISLTIWLLVVCRNDYHWIELEHDTLRAKRLFWGGEVVRPLNEVIALDTLYHEVSTTETLIAEKLLGRVRGIEIRFLDNRTPLRVMRADPAMTNAEALIQAIAYRMSLLHPLQCEALLLEGKPFVKQIGWQGSTVPPPPNRWHVAMWGLFIYFSIMLGAGTGVSAQQRAEKSKWMSKPPVKMTAAELIRQGPGEQRFVQVTNFDPGEVVYEHQKNNDYWTNVWLPLFPEKAKNRAGEIELVLKADSVHNEKELRKLLKDKSITGICSEKKSSSWGTELGPKMIKANRGKQLNAAWQIEELSAAPSNSGTLALALCSLFTYAAAVVCSLMLLKTPGPAKPSPVLKPLTGVILTAADFVPAR